MSNAFKTQDPLHKLEIGHDDPAATPVGTYTLSNPHPEYGSNPHVISPLGYTSYPKMIYPWGNRATDDVGNFRMVRVENEEEEKKWMADPDWQSKEPQEKADW